MKKIIFNSCKLLLPFIGIFALAFSCTDVEDDDFFTEGGSVLFYQNVSPGFYDLGNLDNTVVGFDIGSNGDAASSADMTVSYSGELGTAGPAGIGNVSLPGNTTVTLVAACEALGIDINGLGIGDTFTFEATSGTAKRTLPVITNCVSTTGSEDGVVYDVVSTGTSTDDCCPDETTVMSTVTLTGSDGMYAISDWSGGLYFEWYAVYGMTADGSGGDITDVCNAITLTTAEEPFGESLMGSGTVDPDTGVITFSWSNGWGDQGVTTMTPQ